MSGEDEPLDDEPEVPPPSPGITRAAGILWIVLGALFMLSCFADVALSAVLQARQPGRPADPTASCRIWVNLGIGIGLFLAGRNVYRGTASDVPTPAILSLLLGLFYLAVGVLGIALLARRVEVALVIGGIAIVMGLGCILPSILALAGRSSYRAWYDHYGPNPYRRRRRRRRRREPDDEPEDRERDDSRREDEGDSREPPWARGRGSSE